jgi:hypothetical protein
METGDAIAAIEAIKVELHWLNEKGGLDSDHALDTLAAIAYALGVPLTSDEDDDEG